MVCAVYVVEDTGGLVEAQLDSADFCGNCRYLKEISQLADGELHDFRITGIGERLMQHPEDASELLLCRGCGHQDSRRQSVGLPFHPVEFAGQRAIVPLIVFFHHRTGDGADTRIEELLELEEFMVLVPMDAFMDDGVILRPDVSYLLFINVREPNMS